jgi:riboflavin kinase/FMN adenylyltransferase
VTGSAPEALALHALPNIGPAALCMGVFDGVHRGHVAMLAATRRAAGLHGAAAVALVFDPHPDEVLKPGTRVPRLTPLSATLRRIVEHGITHALPIRFDDELRQRSAEEFLAALHPSLTLRSLVMSPESAFGRGRGGTIARMQEHGHEHGFEVVTVEPLMDGGAPISSSRLREAVAAGDVSTIRRLGEPAFLQGVVVEGDHRGRELGYPTANLRFEYVPAMPSRGIYTGRAAVPERGVGPGHPALVSIGVRPTFHDQGRLLVEVHLLDFDGDLYGTTLEVELLDRLRQERRFDSAGALVAQMRRDEADARRLLGLDRT